MKKKYLLSILLFWLGLIGYSQQQTNPLSIEIQELKNTTTIPDFLAELKQITAYDFAYATTLIPNLDKVISLDIKNETLEKVLRQLFKGKQIEFKIIGKRIHIKELPPQKKPNTINGYIRNEGGEALIGATIFVKGSEGIGTSTNVYGYYALSMPEGAYHLEVSYLGYESKIILIDLSNDKRQDITLNENTSQLVEIIVEGKREEATFDSPVMSAHALNVQQLKTLPTIAGEPDVLKMVQMLPGVNAVGEGSSGIYVRGGNLDQNLILLDEAPIYNPNHLLGFFSAFNTDAIRHAAIYKSSFPIEYGGRLSSVLDLRMKEGNKEKFGVEGGVGLLVSRLHLEGPLKKEKSSFMVSARRTYPDLFLLFSNDNGGNKVHFYDINAKANLELNKNNHLFISGYFGRDIFRFFDQYEKQMGK